MGFFYKNLPSFADNDTLESDRLLSNAPKVYLNAPGLGFNDPGEITINPVQNLAAEATATDTIRLTWDEYTSGLDSYTLEYSEQSDFSSGVTEVTEIDSELTQYDVTGLTNGTRYYFRLKVVSGSLESAFSNTANDTTIPIAVENLAAESTGTDTINITWDAYAGNADYLRLEYSTIVDFSASVVQVNGISTVSELRTLETLINGTLYYSRIAAVKNDKVSAWSNTANDTTNPLSVQNLAAEATDTDTIRLTWDTYAGNADSFTARYSLTSDFSSGVTEVTGIDPSLELRDITGLDDGLIYYFQIKAVKNSSETDYSDSVNAVTWLNFGLALDFDGVNDQVGTSLPSEGIDYATGLFISFWVKVNTTGQTGESHFLWINGDTSDRYLKVWLDNRSVTPGDNFFRIQTQNGIHGEVPAFTVPEDTQWHNISLFVKDNVNGTTKDIIIFLDGEQKINIDYLNNRFMPTFGSFRGSGFGDLFGLNRIGVCTLDELVVINGVDLSVLDLETHYNNGHGTRHLYGHVNEFLRWSLNKSGATGGGDNTALSSVVEDSSGNGYDGTLTNFAKNGASSNWVNNDIND